MRIISMAKENNLSDLLSDIASAIREKKGTAEPINAQDFASEIASIETKSGGSWTGHADVEGLKAIGWTDEDIAYYQAHGVNWNAEDDEYHKVTDDNKALYGVLTADNIQTYKDRIVYLPKIDTSAKTSMNRMFYDCQLLISIPQLDTSKVTDMTNMFRNCYRLVCIPPLDMSSVEYSTNIFYYCYSLTSLPPITLKDSIRELFYNCYNIESIEVVDSGNSGYWAQTFYNCFSLQKIHGILDASLLYNTNNVFVYCINLVSVYIKNIVYGIAFKYSPFLSKESLLYLINNEAAPTAITITLHSYAYERLATDADVVAALANHPNITLAKA